MFALESFRRSNLAAFLLILLQRIHSIVNNIVNKIEEFSTFFINFFYLDFSIIESLAIIQDCVITTI